MEMDSEPVGGYKVRDACRSREVMFEGARVWEYLPAVGV